MPVTVTVSEVRESLYRAAGSQSARGTGAPSIAVLGQWFHEAIGWLVNERNGRSSLAVLADVDQNLDVWKQTLVTRVYTQFVGPRLTGHQAALQDVGPQVLSFWQAIQEACHWVAELAWSLRSGKSSRAHPRPTPWKTLSEFLSTEEPLSCEIREPGWHDSVRLTGIADAIVRLTNPPGAASTPVESGRTAAWCAIEFKLGQTSPAADLGQACLYHLMLASQGNSNGTDTWDGTLALVSFQPERHEQLFDAAALATARSRLIDVIGKLAGVDPNQSVPPVGRTHPVVQESNGDTGSSSNLPTRRIHWINTPTEAHLQLGEKLVSTLTNEYKVVVSLEGPPIVGPTFLRFPIRLGPRMRVAAVQNRVEELQLRLGLLRPPFITIDNGVLVVDVQRPDRQKVCFDDIRDQLPQPDARLGGSHVPIGVDIYGQLVCANLATTEHSHLLAAGTTGSGKSEWLRLAIAGLMVTNTPETLRLVVIDPKRNAFHALRKSPYLWKPLVFPDEHPAAGVLQELAEEMDRRYRLLDGADSHAQLVARSDAPLPRIVCICDEYRDLISRSREERKQIEEQICRLGAKARAAGIHLILATQEPRRETIKGPLDSNIPARVGLWMQKAQESRMLLSESGAEKLLGNGDLLFKDAGPPRRLQAPLLTEENRDQIFGR